MRAFAGNPALRRYWHPVLRGSELAPGPVGVRLLETDVAIWRDASGTVAAALDHCPHREAPLSLGQVTAEGLECAYHGWTYGVDGRCTRIPSQGSGPIPPKACLESLLCAERYGLVWLCLGEPAAGIPEIPEDADRAFRRINLPVEAWQAAATRMVDNFLDISHFPYVHRASFGGASPAEVPRIDLEPLGDFYGYRYAVTASNANPVASASSGQEGATVARRMTTGFALPFAVRSTIHYDSGLTHSMLLVSTPVDDTSSRFCFVVWRNDDFSVPAEEVTRLDRLIGAEDRRMLERVPGSLLLDRLGLVSVQADKASVEWRRRLLALLSGADEPQPAAAR